ncbi:asparaginase domain-containing protein [Ketogulonicigenium vulgare]|uniref:asparaginase domain-containing protein n=1 Tax=Ketogulonicigenium vulgare TaxID=92945 RepID=UPI00235901C3|nr:asparaginase domain-containing protein [Ketogulonicigenium vulgare]
MQKMRIAHVAGPNATITNAPPLVTSNKARAKAGLPLLTDDAGAPSRFDPLRAQRLAAPVEVFIAAYSAHPMEEDAADLYAPPDGYLDEAGHFAPVADGAHTKPVYRVTLDPADGLYPLPYMGLQADGSAWESDGTSPFAPREKSRQPFFPDGQRLIEEIDRLGVDSTGIGNNVSNHAEISYFRVLPSAGYTKQGEVSGKDFFPYRPAHLNFSPPRSSLATATNDVQRIMDSADVDAMIWTQGSPRIEETSYWFSLLIDTVKPICANASQRYTGQISNDGPKNVADSVEWLTSGVWADEQGRNMLGAVMAQDQRVYAAREVVKVDARPGGYDAAGGHGGILGGAGGVAGSVLRYIPAMKHTWKSDLRLSQLPTHVPGHAGPVQIKDAEGWLLPDAIPKVAITKDSSYSEEGFDSDPDQEVDVIALIEKLPGFAPLCGLVSEGLNPYGKPASSARNAILRRAAFSGFPVVNVGRGNTEGFALAGGPFIAGSNLTAVKARILLMACILKFGMLPKAANPKAPTPAEVAAVMAALKPFQQVFDTH